MPAAGRYVDTNHKPFLHLNIDTNATQLAELVQPMHACKQNQAHITQAVTAAGCSRRTFRVTLRIVTNSSADDGWMPTTVSSCALVTPSLTATAKPCRQQWQPAAHQVVTVMLNGIQQCGSVGS